MAKSALEPTVKTYSFRISEALAKAIEERKFVGETRSQVLVRLLLSLEEAIREKRFTPPAPIVPSGARVRQTEVNASRLLAEFIEKTIPSLGAENNSIALNILLKWALLAPIETELMTPQDTMDWLKESYGETVRPLLLRKVIPKLTLRTSLETARAHIDALAKQGRIRLRIGKNRSQNLVTIANGRQYHYIQWADPSIPILDWNRMFLGGIIGGRQLEALPDEALIENRNALRFWVTHQPKPLRSQIEISLDQVSGDQAIEEVRDAVGLLKQRKTQDLLEQVVIRRGDTAIGVRRLL